MASNHSGIVAGLAQDHVEFAAFPSHDSYSNQWNNAPVEQPQQMYHPFPSSFPSYNPSYHEHNGPSQSRYQPTIAPSYYQPNPVPEVSYDYQLYPAQSHNFPSYSTYQNTSNQYRNDYQHFGNTSTLAPSPYVERDTPMQRMQQLTQLQYGGPLAAQSAAAAAEEAAQAARRISPPSRKRSGAEETVRDVLRRQYVEQKRQEAQMQQMHQQQLLQQVPIAQPASSIPLLQSAQPSMPCSFSSVPPSDSLPPPTQATPSFPSVTSTLLHSRTPPPTCGDSSSASSSSTLTPDPDVSQQAMVARLKQSRITSHNPANAVATDVKHSNAVSTGVTPAATVVQSERAILPPLSSSSSSSRKRPLDDRSEPPLKPGMRREFNEKGESVERLYVLVHHCNHNDPDYNADGVLMPYDEYKKEEKRDDMITFSYSSVATPYEYVDFRVKKQETARAERDAVFQP